MSIERIRSGLQRGRWTFLPVAPQGIEFAALVRRRLMEMRPRRVAVELPWSCETMLRRAIGRLPAITAVIRSHQDAPSSGLMVLVQPADALTEAARTALELGSELVFIGGLDCPMSSHLEVYPDPSALAYVPYESYVEQYLRTPPPSSGAGGGGWEAVALLRKLDENTDTAVVLRLSSFVEMLPLLDLMPPAVPEVDVGKYEVLLVSPESLGEVLFDCPYLQERYEDFRTSGPQPAVPDRVRWLEDLWQEAARNYRAIYRGEIAPWQRRQASRFLARLTTAGGLLTPTLFDLVAAARGVIADNFAYELWRLGVSYRHQQPEPGQQMLALSAADIFPDTRRLRLRQRYERAKRFAAPRHWKRRPGPATGAWAVQPDGDAICSYPPEDIIIEDFGRSLRRRAVTLLGEERSRVEPFTTSLLDGVDVRETIRRWHKGRIYVRETEKLTGEAGAVVVIFDEDRDNRFPWLTTWLGEHSNESDMAFYSTPPFDNLVGPGIGRAEYGGFLMTMPPGRMADVWTDPDYDFAETKPERLLLAAIDYSLERRIVYVAARPPRSILRQAAARLGRQILYIPLGALSPEKLRRIRTLHVLDSHERRRIAARYIW